MTKINSFRKENINVRKNIVENKVLSITNVNACKNVRRFDVPKGLRDSINRRNLEALEESLQQARASQFSHKLQPLIQKAEEEVADLKKTDKHAHDILEMNLLTVTELRNYKNPKPIVHDVMKATFILLGERQDLLEVKYISYFICRLLQGSNVSHYFFIKFILV